MDQQLSDEFTIFQKSIIQRLEDREWFIDCIAYNYSLLAQSRGCGVSMSTRRLGEAFDFWREDNTRTLSEGIETSVNLDHFKHASFVAFWLRRMIPINQTVVVSEYQAVPQKKNATEQQKFFLRCGNELCAFLIGFQICLFYEFGTKFEGDNVVDLVGQLQGTRLRKLQQHFLPPAMVADFVMILKHKNMSPHALYLLYKSLFATIAPRQSGRLVLP